MDYLQVAISLAAVGLGLWLFIVRRRARSGSNEPPALEEGYNWWSGHIYHMLTANGVAKDALLLNVIKLVEASPHPVTAIYTTGPSWLMKPSYFVKDPVLMERALARGERTQRIREVIAECVGKTAMPVLVGQEWQRHRRLMNPAMNVPKALRRFAEIMAENSKKSLDALQLQGGDTDDSPVVIDAINTNIITSALTHSMGHFNFGMDISKTSGTTSDAIKMRKISSCLHELFQAMHHRLFTTGIRKLMHRFSLYEHRRLRQTLDFLQNEVIRPSLDRRRQEIADGEDVPNDALTFMLEAHEEESDSFSDAELCDELLFFISASYDTVGASLDWALYYLARYPEHQETCYKEVMKVMSTKGDDELPELQDLDRFQYLQCVVKESQRLSPAFPLLARFFPNGTELGGYTIPAGSRVNSIPIIACRSNDFYEDADKFLPSRWMDDMSGGGVKSASGLACAPFGHGKYRCFGTPIGKVAMHVLLAVWIQRYRMELVAGSADDVKFQMTCMPRDLRIRMHKRSRHSA